MHFLNYSIWIFFLANPLCGEAPAFM